MSKLVAAVKLHPYRYEKDFYAVTTYLSQYVKKWGPKMSIKLVPITQSKLTKT